MVNGRHVCLEEAASRSHCVAAATRPVEYWTICSADELCQYWPGSGMDSRSTENQLASYAQEHENTENWQGRISTSRVPPFAE